MIELKPCSICKGPTCTEQIDSSIGVLTGIQCADTECNGHWNNGWFEDEDDAIAWWNDRQIGVAAMNHVLPFNEVSRG